MIQLLEEATALAGRDIEIEETRDGRYIVLWMCFGTEPPPKGNTEQAAVEEFIKFMKNRKENTDENRTGHEPSGSQNDQGAEGTERAEQQGD